MMTLAAAQTRELLVVIGLLMAFVVIGAMLVLLFRRKVLEDDASVGEMSVIGELRRLRDEGEISPEEFEVAKRRAAERIMGKPVETPPIPRTDQTELIAPPGLDLAGDPLPPAAFEEDEWNNERSDRDDRHHDSGDDPSEPR